MSMDIIAVSQDFCESYVIDFYESLIWSERFGTCGDFELTIPASSSIASKIKCDWWMIASDSTATMIVETIEIEADTEQGDRFVFSGRSVESILERRVWPSSWVIESDFTLRQAITTMITKWFIYDSERSGRAISLSLSFDESDDELTALLDQFIVLDVSYRDGLDVFEELFESYQVAYQIVVDMMQEPTFKMTVCMAKNRSYAQSTNLPVLFSHEIDNLFAANYLETTREMATSVTVTGEGDGVYKTARGRYKAEFVGLNRREVVESYSSFSSSQDEDIAQSDYLELLAELADTLLEERASASTAFEAEIDISHGYVYNQDYFIGDIVQIEDPYGHSEAVQITEMVYSSDSSGNKWTPTLTSITQEE